MAPRLQVEIGASITELEKRLNEAVRKLQDASDNMVAIGKGLSVAVSAPLTLLGGLAVKVFSDFSQEMAKVRAISGATATEFEALKKSAEELGAATRFSASDVAGLQLNLSKLGFDPKQINDSTAAILDLALATGEDLAQSAEVAAATIQGFGLETTEAGRVADVMAASFSASALGLSKFQVAMATVAPVAKTAGQSLESTTALLSVLANAGLDASTSGTALRNIFLRIAKDGGTLDGALEQIANSSNKSATAMKLFGIQGATAATILADNANQAKEFTKQYENAAGAASEMAEIMDDTLTGAFANMQSAAEGVMIAIGESLEPALRKLLGVVSNALNWFTNLNPVMRDIIVSVGAFAAALGPLLIGLGGIIKIAPFVSAAVTAMGGPYAILAGAVIALGVAMVKNWETIKETIQNTAMQVIEVVSEMAMKVATFINRLGFSSLAERIGKASEAMRGYAKSWREGAENTRKMNEFIEMNAFINENAAKNAKILAGQMNDLANSTENAGEAAKRAYRNFWNFNAVIGFNGKEFKPVKFIERELRELDRGFAIDIGKPNITGIIDQAKAAAMDFADAFNDESARILGHGIGDAISDIASGIGDALANGGSVIESMGAAFLGGMGGILKQLGEMAIQVGVGVLAVKTALETLNPFVAIAAGAALVAIGSAFASNARSLGGQIAGQGQSSQNFTSGSVVTSDQLRGEMGFEVIERNGDLMARIAYGTKKGGRQWS